MSKIFQVRGINKSIFLVGFLTFCMVVIHDLHTLNAQQVPQGIMHQSVIRNNNGSLVINQSVAVRISVLQGTSTGAAVFVETHQAQTNANGLLSLKVGGGLAQNGSGLGGFNQIVWGSGPYFLKTEVDPLGGTNYTLIQTSELLSVPFALYSQQSLTPGPVGPQGAQGIPGNDGAVGPQGPQGIPGNDGAVGPQGPIGLTGSVGPAGNDGVTGPQGPIGLTGPAGNDGAVGPQGPIGLTGPAGNDGAVGPQGPQGIPGNDGAVGPQGPIGLTGPAGNDGAVGPQGPQGIQGIDGAVGPQGPIGLTGPAGPQGAQGNDGAVGPQGPMGSFPSGTQPGAMNYWNGTSWISVPPGSSGQFLIFCDGVPTWSWGGCLPRVTTTAASSVTLTGAITGGDVTSDGGSPVTGRGSAYGKVQNPTIADSTTSDGTGTGVFTSTLIGLTASTNYFVRAYATNSVGTIYGNEESFTTSAPTPPQLTTTTVSSVTWIGAMTGGDVSSDGGSPVTGRGSAYGIVQNPNTADNTTSDGTGTGVFTSTLIGLTASTNYYVRAYATNSVGTAYGNEVSFMTESLPGVRCPGTPTVTDIDGNVYNTVQIGNQCWTLTNLKVSKYVNGATIPTGLSSSEWSTTTSGAYAIYNNDPVKDGLFGKLYNHYTVKDSRGLCPSGWRVPSDADLSTLVNQLGVPMNAGGALKSTGIQPAAWGWASPNTGATNSSGFTALPGGVRGFSGGFSSLTSSGSFWSSDGNGTGLSSNAWYRNVIYANSTIYRSTNYRSTGMSVRCVMGSGGPVSDVDNNGYDTVQIGTQVWMKSNLKTSRYRNGDSIQSGLSNSSWQNTTSGAYAIYNNDLVNNGLYGKLYNHHAVTDIRGLCPTGWHVPSDGEWTTLENYLGGSWAAGGAIRSTATQPTPGGWDSPASGTTNSSGFTALPGGMRGFGGDFSNATFSAVWWSSSLYSGSVARSLDLYSSTPYTNSSINDRTHGLSVRCVMD